MLASTRILDILEQAQIEPPKAKAITRAFEEAEREIASDVKGVLEEKLQHFSTKEDIAVLRSDLIALESRLIKWIVGVVVSQAIVLLGGAYFLASHAK
ncbi:MAG: hypothetical protein V1746_00160 [bacterium]